MLKQFLIVVALLAAVLESKPTDTEVSEMEKFLQRVSQNQNTFGTKLIQPRNTVQTYSYSDFVAYATNCDWADSAELYKITSVDDAIKCGSEYCYTDKRCTHFSYDPATPKTCTLRTVYGQSGSININYGFGKTCGKIPVRACKINSGSISSLLGCLAIESL